jgi:hypothetical protein
VLIDVRQDLRHGRLHSHKLLAVVTDAGSIQAALVMAFVPHKFRRAYVFDNGAKLLAFHTRHLLKLLGVRVVEAELETVKTGVHAGADAFGRGHAAVRGEKDVRKAHVLFSVSNRFPKPWAKKRFAKVKHAQLFDARLAHLADNAAKEVFVHIRLFT